MLAGGTRGYDLPVDAPLCAAARIVVRVETDTQGRAEAALAPPAQACAP
jgi:hypothetical protein